MVHGLQTQSKALLRQNTRVPSNEEGDYEPVKLTQDLRTAGSTVPKDNLKGKFHEPTLPLQEPFLDTSDTPLQVNIPVQNITNLPSKPQPTQLMPPYPFDAMDYFHNAPNPLFISGGKEAQPSLKPLLNFTLDPETIFNKGPKLLDVL